MAAADHEPNSIQLYHQSNWEDTLKHHSIIDRLYYWEEIDKIGAIEAGSNAINIYTVTSASLIMNSQ